MKKLFFVATLLLSVLSSGAQLIGGFKVKEYRSYCLTVTGDSVVGKIELPEVNRTLDSVLTMPLQDGEATFINAKGEKRKLKVTDSINEVGFWSQGRIRKFFRIKLYENDDVEKKYEYKFLSVFKLGKLSLLGYVYEQRAQGGSLVDSKDYYTEHIVLNNTTRVTFTPRLGLKKEKFLRLVKGCSEAENFIAQMDLSGKSQVYTIVEFYNENCK
jgi:hypothetical protein